SAGSDEFFFLQHHACPLEQTRFTPAGIKFGAVTAKNDDQQHGHGRDHDMEGDSQRRKVKAQTRKRFDTWQGPAASPTAYASDSSRHPSLMRARWQECNCPRHPRNWGGYAPPWVLGRIGTASTCS